MSTTEEVLQRHLDALAAGDVDGLMRDYDDDAVMITGAHVTRGRAAIEQLFQAVADHPPKIFEDVRVVEGDVAYVTWHSDSRAFGTDTFVMRDGKIAYQTVALP